MRTVPSTLAYVSAFFTLFFLCLSVFGMLKDIVSNYFRNSDDVNKFIQDIKSEFMKGFIRNPTSEQSQDDSVSDTSSVKDDNSNVFKNISPEILGDFIKKNNISFVQNEQPQDVDNHSEISEL